MEWAYSPDESSCGYVQYLQEKEELILPKDFQIPFCRILPLDNPSLPHLIHNEAAV